MKNGRWLGCLLAGTWCCCEPGWGSLPTCLGCWFATATMLPLVQGWSAGVDGRLMRFFSTAALPLLWVGAATGWIMVLPVLPLCWVGRNSASCLQADVSLWCYFEGACSRWLGYSRESIPFIFYFASLSCFGLFKGACSLCLDLYVLFVLLVSSLSCSFWSIQYLHLIYIYKKIEIWSRKAEKGLIGVWHNGNLPQGTNTIGLSRMMPRSQLIFDKSDSVRSRTEECKNLSHTLKLKNSEVIIIKAAEILAYMSLNSS